MSSRLSLQQLFISAVTGIAFVFTTSFSDCDSRCQSDLADVKKAIDDVAKARRREEEEIAPNKESGNSDALTPVY